MECQIHHANFTTYGADPNSPHSGYRRWWEALQFSQSLTRGSKIRNLNKESCFLPACRKQQDQGRPFRTLCTPPGLGSHHGGHFRGPKKAEEQGRTQVINPSCLVLFSLGTAERSKTFFLLISLPTNFSLSDLSILSPCTPSSYKMCCQNKFLFHLPFLINSLPKTCRIKGVARGRFWVYSVLKKRQFLS